MSVRRSHVDFVCAVPWHGRFDVQLRLGPDRDAQALKSFFKPQPADGTKVLSEDQIKARLEGDAQNNFEDVSRRAEALKLTARQVQVLNGLAKRLGDEQFGALSPSITAYFEMDEPTFQRLMASTNLGTLMELITGEGPN